MNVYSAVLGFCLLHLYNLLLVESQDMQVNIMILCSVQPLCMVDVV